MTVPALMIVFGALLVYGGWTNRSIWALARGDNTVPKSGLGQSTATRTSATSARTSATSARTSATGAVGPHAGQTR